MLSSTMNWNRDVWFIWVAGTQKAGTLLFVTDMMEINASISIGDGEA